MNTKGMLMTALAVLLLMAAPITLQAEPATEKAEHTVSVRVFNQAQLQSLFHNICSPKADSEVGAPTVKQMLVGFSDVIEECSTPCCAHCTRCANTGEQDDCDYCDTQCKPDLD